MFKGFNMDSYTLSYNFGYLLTDDRWKGNDRGGGVMKLEPHKKWSEIWLTQN